MKNKFIFNSGTLLIRLLLFMFLSTTVILWGCDKAEEAAVPGGNTALSSAQTQAAKAGSDKDETYKTDRTGQYVSKDVQVTGYEDGSERPTRPKFDAADAISTMSVPIEPPCDPNVSDCSGQGPYYPPAPPTMTPVSSIGIGHTTTSKGFIYDLKVIKGSSSSINTGDLPGYYKIGVDLNKGAGGKYIYLCFTRDPSKVIGSSSWVGDGLHGRNVPVEDIIIKRQTVGGGFGGWPGPHAPPIETKDGLGFHQPDLNDGAGGKYIYAYQDKDSYVHPSTVYEVGVIYGSSSAIQPPQNSGWRRIEGDLNDGAGGDYIYFVVKE